MQKATVSFTNLGKIMGQGQLSSVDAKVMAISEFPLRFLGSFGVQIVSGLPPLSPLFQPVLQYTIPQES